MEIKELMEDAIEREVESRVKARLEVSQAVNKESVRHWLLTNDSNAVKECLEGCGLSRYEIPDNIIKAIEEENGTEDKSDIVIDYLNACDSDGIKSILERLTTNEFDRNAIPDLIVEKIEDERISDLLDDDRIVSFITDHYNCFDYREIIRLLLDNI